MRMVKYITPQMMTLICCTLLIAVGQQLHAGERPRVGAFAVSFDQHDARCRFADFVKRTLPKAAADKAMADPANATQQYVYELGGASWRMYVPENYDGREAMGLLVWIDAGDKPVMPAGWAQVLRARRMIYIAAENSGNNRDVGERIAMALDAAFNVARQYKIDEQRVYVSGMSGGGRCASWAAISYPDVFTGGLFICGVNFYKPLELPGKGTLPAMMGFDPALLEKAKADHRYVLLTGDRDPNQPSTKVVYQGFVDEKFAHVNYVQVPGMGHVIPNAKWFTEGLDKLDPRPRK